MKRLPSLLAACALAVTLASCTKYGVFEDVGADPHPPTVQLLGIALQPPPPPPPVVPASAEEIAPTSLRGLAERTAFFDTGGFTVRPYDETANTFILTVRYTDVGGDLVKFKVRDRDGTFSAEAAPVGDPIDTDGDGEPDASTPLDFFPGVVGVTDLRDLLFVAKQEGPHRLELWAEDSHGSRSEKVEFVINVELF